MEGPPRSVGIRELRSDLATFVRRANNGERIVVSIAGHPVAQLGPITPISSPSLDDMAASGLVRLPGRSDRPGSPPPVSLPVDARADQIVAELRGDGPSRARRRR